jgi:ubiquinone/menaquinone biosynthesis C-methylase UbiE
MENESNFDVKFLDPQAVLDQLEIKDGMRVADFGCGAGHFSLVAAKKVGEKGVVFAIDILPEKLETVRSQAKNLGLTNIQVKHENLERESGSKLPDKSIDWVIIKDMLYQNKEKSKILSEASRVLTEKGRILLVEWITENTSIGPQRELRISKEEMIDLAQKNGLGVLKEVEAGDFHYGLVLIK